MAIIFSKLSANLTKVKTSEILKKNPSVKILIQLFLAQILGPHIVRTIDKGDDFLCEKKVSGQAHFCYSSTNSIIWVSETLSHIQFRKCICEAATHLNVVVFSTEQQQWPAEVTLVVLAWTIQRKQQINQLLNMMILRKLINYTKQIVRLNLQNHN